MSDLSQDFHQSLLKGYVLETEQSKPDHLPELLTNACVTNFP